MRRHHNYKPNHRKMRSRLRLRTLPIHSFGYEIFRKSVSFLTVISFLFSQVIIPYSPAYAGNITDVPGLTPDGSTNTVTDRAPNNTPIVNIAAPSAGGVSLNNWSDYNVTSENQILNNAKGATVDTQLAGQIYGNPNLTQPGVNEAAIIVNQITSTNRTNINGYVEVAGRRAELIVANPNGLSISGGGFINVSRLGLVSGSVNMNGSGSIDSFTLGNGQNSNIIITGVDTPTYANLGLDASKVDYVDIITRSIQVLGDIHAKSDLNFRLGNGTYDYNNRTINSDSSLGTSTKPSFALDSSYLGGMYAGRISLIATENGIGVRARSDLVSKASEINFEVAGDIDYERLNAETNINLTSNQGKITQGKYATLARPALTYAKGNITLTGATGIELNDSSQASNFYAAGSIYLNSANGLVKNNSTIKADSASQANGGLFISSASFENTSLTFSSNNLSITTTGLTKNTSGSIESAKNITVNSGSFVNSSLIKAGTDATLVSTGSFTDTNQIKASGNLSITTNTGISYNDLYSGGNLSLNNNTSGDINHNYKSYSVGTTTITNNGGNIVFGLADNSNNGSLYSKGNLIARASSNITNNSNIFSEAKIDLTAQSLTNNMRIMAIGAGAGLNASDLTINLDSNLLNRGLLFANQNINLNVDGTVTNDGTYNAEIFALNGNVNINGKLYSTSYGNVSKYDFFTLSFDKSAEIWADLLAKGYIDSNGKITDAFKDLTSASGMNVDASLSAYKDAIYNTLTALSTKLVQGDSTCATSSSCKFSDNNDGSKTVTNSLDRIAKDFDNKASDIYTTLRNSGYIDSSGKVTQQFYTDTKTGGADAMVFKDANGNPLSDTEISYLKNDIYQLLQDARTGKVIENIFLGISGLNSGQVASGVNQGANLSSALITELKAKGYIDADGNVTSTFTALGSADALAANLSSDFTPYKQVIFDQINAAKSVNKASTSNFSGIAYQPINSINNYNLLYAKLVADGYVDGSGNFTSKFTDDSNAVTASDDLANYKTTLETIFASKNTGDAITASDFSSVTYLPINNINDSTALVNQLKTEGFIDDKGNITEKFYTDGIASSTSSLANYQGSISTILGGITQATLADSSFRKITKSLDNSAARLVSELITAGYLDENGKKAYTIDPTSGQKIYKFNFADANAFADAFASVATDGEYAAAKTAIFDALAAQNDTYSFRDSDFLGGGFDSNVLFNENQILMNNLITNGYVSSDGDVKQNFYNLSGNYTNLNLDSRFSGLKGQIGGLLAQVAPSQTTITNNNLVTVASGSTRDKAGQIFDKMVAKGYFNAKGDFTQKLMDEVVNYSGDDAQKTAQLQLDEFSDYASGVYQQIKARNGTTSIKNYTTKVENINGGKISSSLGDINIKAITFNNVAKDNKDVVSNPENGVARTPYRGIGWAWQNTVLWGYDTVTSTLDSNQSFLRAGKNLSIEADNVWNNSSVITAGNNLDLRLTNLNNTRTQFTTSVPYIYETHWKRCRRFRGCNSGRYQNWYWNTVLLRSNTPSVISSGNSLNIAALNDVRLDTPTINAGLINASPAQGGTNPNTPTSSTWQISVPTSNNGLFKKAAPDSKYLIESAYNANDPNRLTGSAYYKSRFGFDPNQNNIKWLGDPFWEWNAINEQILKITKKQRDWSDWEKSDKNCALGGLSNCGQTSQNTSGTITATTAPAPEFEKYLNDLIDNAYDQQADLHLVPGVKLTLAQINALKKDIVWYEEETVTLADGSTQKVAVPRVYLTKDSFFDSDFGTNSVIAARNVSIKAGGNIDSNGTVISSLEKTNLDAVGNISIKNDYYLLPKPPETPSLQVASFGQISVLGIKDDARTARSGATFNAGTDLQINSGGSINIANNYFQTGGSIFMTAANDINNSNYTIKAGNNVVMDATNINNIHTSTGNGGAETRIEAGNMASLNASNNITNIGGTIRGGNLLYMTAGNNITNKALVDYKINGSSATEDEALSSQANRITSSLISKGSLESGGNLVLVAGNNLNNIGSKITSTGSAYLEATNGDINITTAVLRDREVTSGGRKKNSWTKTVDTTTNVASEIAIGGNLETLSGKATSITGSKVNVTGNLTANVGTNLIIANAVNSSFNATESKKRGSVKTVVSVSSDYVETALESDVKANNITLNVGTSGSGGTLLIQGSKMNSTTNTTTNAVNTIITDAILQESHYSHKATSSRGIARVGTAITSTVMGIVGGYLHYVGNIIKPIDDGAFRGWVDNQLMDNQFVNIKQKNFETKKSTHSQASNVTAGNNLTITSTASGGSGGDTTIQASNISATNQLTLNAKNLNILTRSETTINTFEDKTTRALSFKNYNEGSINTDKIINSTLNANSIVYNVTGKANVEVDAKTDQSSLPYLIALKNQTSPESIIIASKSNFSQDWHDANGGLTGAGTALVAIVIVAAVIVSGGAAAPAAAAAAAGGVGTAAGIAAGTAVAVGVGAGTAAATTAAISATNSSMNAEGGIGKQAKTVSKDTYKATTSDEALKSYAIAGIAAGLTFGITQGINAATATSATSSGTGAGAGSGAGASAGGTATTGATTTTTASSSASTTVSTTTTAASSSIASNSSSLYSQIGTALKESAISTISSTAAQSAVNGDSFGEALKNQWKNVLIGAVGNIAANQIGNAAHGSITKNADGTLTYTPPSISGTEQLALHAVLGCGMAAAGGNDCASGAVSGVVGELTAEAIGDNTNIRGRELTELAGLSGGVSAIFTGNAVGLDDQEIADNIFSGQRIATNAAQNNYQKDVHKYLTKYLAENAGFTPEEATEIARGDYRVDTRLSTQPLTSDSFMEFFGLGRPKEDYHFTSPERLAEMRKTAFESGDKRLLGEYLHAYQDSFSHQKDGVTYDTKWGHSDLNFKSWFTDVGLTENKVPISHGLMNDSLGGFGEYVDRTYNRPELADQMAKGTYSEMQEFIKYQNSRTPNDWQQIINQTNQINPIQQPLNQWNQILDRVQNFNRTINNNNDEKGQTLFR